MRDQFEISEGPLASGSFSVRLQGIAKDTTSTLSAVVIISNACLGAATLNIPATFAQAGGVIPSMIIMIISALLNTATLMVFAYTRPYAQGRKLVEMSDYAVVFVGRTFARFQQVILVMQVLGTTSAYVLIVGDQAGPVMAQTVGEEYYCSGGHWWVNGTFVEVLVTALVIFPLCLTKNVDFLKYPSYLTVVGILYVVLDVFMRWMMTGRTEGAEVTDWPENFYDVFNAFPTILLGFLCHFNATPVLDNMATKDNWSWLVVSVGASLACFVNYSLIGVAGYLTYGDQVDTDIIVSMPNDAADVTLARVMMAVAVTMSYPVLYFAAKMVIDEWLVIGLLRFESWWGHVNKSHYITSQAQLDKTFFNPTNRRIGVACLWVPVTLIIAVAVPSLGTVTKFTGSLASIFFLISPGMCLAMTSFMTRQNPHQTDRWRIAKIAMGISCVGLGTLVAAQGLSTAVLVDLIWGELDSEEVFGPCTKL